MIFLRHHQMHFRPIDPLGDGLGDEIAAERNEPEAIRDLAEPLDADMLQRRWSVLLEEVKSDPEWFEFAND
ncbi:TPA: hypothetical protein DEW05_03370 [Candidatus Saccharibacteria bacterium]|nr:hypothetical protein [Candidatus Saccharibacteria bacterium]